MRFNIFREIPLEKQFDYNLLLLSSPYTLFYQSLSYHALLKLHLACESVYFLWEKSGVIVASLPLLYKTDNVYGTVFNSLPFFGSNGSFVFHNSLDKEEKEQIQNEGIRALDEFAKQSNGTLITIITSPFQQEDKNSLKACFQTHYEDSRVGQITTLPDHSSEIENDLMNMFSDPRPRNIRRARKAGINVSIRHDLAALKFLYKIHRENIESIGGKAKREDFFESIPSFFNSDEYAVYTATKDGKLIAALLVFYFNKTVEYFTPATIHDYRNDQPSALLIFDAMKNAAERGFKYWNWGGTWKTQHGVYDFKRKWGATDHEYYYYTQLLDENVREHNILELTTVFPNFYLYPY